MECIRGLFTTTWEADCHRGIGNSLSKTGPLLFPPMDASTNKPQTPEIPLPSPAALYKGYGNKNKQVFCCSLSIPPDKTGYYSTDDYFRHIEREKLYTGQLIK